MNIEDLYSISRRWHTVQAKNHITYVESRGLKVFLEEILEEIAKREKITNSIKNPDDLHKNEVVYYAVLKEYYYL